MALVFVAMVSFGPFEYVRMLQLGSCVFAIRYGY